MRLFTPGYHPLTPRSLARSAVSAAGFSRGYEGFLPAGQHNTLYGTQLVPELCLAECIVEDSGAESLRGRFYSISFTVSGLSWEG
jgi:hypothetical protein